MNLAMEQTARELFNREFQKQHGNPQASNRHEQFISACPVSWLLPKLLRVVFANHDRSLEEIEPLIRSVLREQLLPAGSQTSQEHKRQEQAIEENVDILMRTFAAVRDVASNQKQPA